MEIQDTYVIYTLPDCKACSLLKEALTRSNLEYTEVVVNKEISSERLEELYPQQLCCPLCVVNGNLIGGLIEVVKNLVEKGLLSKTKKS